MRDQAYAVEAEVVEQVEHVLGQLPAVVAVRGRIGPAGTAQVGGDHPVLLGEPRNDVAPLPPVLGEAVQQQDRVAAARLGHVHAQSGQVDEVVCDAGQGRNHGIARYYDHSFLSLLL